MVWYGNRSTGPANPVDTFEDDNLTEYTDTSANYTIQTGTVKEGQRALQVDPDNTPMYSSSGLDNYPAQGDSFSLWVRTANITDEWLYVFFAGSTGIDDHYRLFCRWPDDTFRIRTDANVDVCQTGNLGLSTDTWYKVIVQWDDGSTFGGSAGDFDLFVENASGTQIGSASGNDTSYTGGNIGYRNTNSSTSDSMYVDHWIITN